MGEMDAKQSVAEQLCRACGLCCNGVIFGDVRLQPGDNPERLRALGLVPACHAKGPDKLMQPCQAFDGCCRIYADRPQYCREFECALLKSVLAGRTELAAALRIVKTARRRAERVLKLLRELGDSSEQISLSKRFRRVQRRMETGPIDEAMADTFGELTLAVHDLNCLLSDAFYPGA